MTEAPAGRRVARITVLTGVPPHTDPWHGLAGTSAAIAETLADLGECTETSTADVRRGAFAGTDLLVVNASGDLAEPPADSRGILDAVFEHHGSGGAVLAVHSASLAFQDDPRWRRLVGGRWVPGTTTHPQIGRSLVQVARAHPVTAGLDDFLVYDERYAALETDPSVDVLAFHTEDGLTHPLAWAVDRGTPGQGRVVYDALGHGVESYDAPGRRALLRAAASWLLDGVARSRGGGEPS